MDALFDPLIAVAGVLLLPVGLYAFWRYFWFFRNPDRRAPDGDNVVSPADGTVVYVKRILPGEPAVSIKRNRKILLVDIVRENISRVSLMIGVFMSPFNVHYNRAPVAGKVNFVHHHPARSKNRHMVSMHWRSLLGRLPIYENSPHLIENERTVTKIDGSFKNTPISCYLVQIAGGSVQGIDTYVAAGKTVVKGQTVGMIRIGSQVDIILDWHDAMTVRVAAGQKVRAGETVLVE